MHAPLLRMVPWLMAGIAVTDAYGLSPSPWAVAAAWLAAAALTRRPRLQVAALGVCLMLIGMTLTDLRRQQLSPAWLPQGGEVEAVVTSEPVVKQRSVGVDLLLTESRQRVKAYFEPDARSRMLQPGSGVLLDARLRPVGNYRIGNFDYGRYLTVHGFSGRCYVRANEWQLRPEAWDRLTATERLKTGALRWRHRLLQKLRGVAQGDDDAYGVLAAMSLGDKSALSHELREAYSLTGASHILALSGLHMGILFGMFALVTRPGRRTAVVRLLTVGLFWAFAVLTGLSTSVVRSALMLSLMAVLSLRTYERLSLNVLSLAAIIMLVANPYTLFDVGFQLSFGAVLAIIVLLPIINGIWPEGFMQRRPVLRAVWSLMAVGLAAQIGTAPLTAYYFGTLSTLFLVTNLVAVPAAYAILWLCLAFMLWPLTLTGQLLTATVQLLNGVLTTMAAWPLASVTGLQPSAWEVALWYVLLAAVMLTVHFVQARKPMVGWPI